jgi:hypothetical protein
VSEDRAQETSPPASAQEATLVADTALALAGYEVPQFVHDLELQIARGEITADEAVAEIIGRHLGPAGVELYWRNKREAQTTPDQPIAATGRPEHSA